MVRFSAEGRHAGSQTVAGAGVPKPGSFGGTGFGGVSGRGVPAGAPKNRFALRLGRWRSEPAGFDNFLDLRAIERFVFEQRAGN